MIAADIQKFAVENLPVNWFDAAVLALLMVGFFRGRKHGMSKEFLPLMKWLCLVLVAGFFYPAVAGILAGSAGLDKLWSCISAYLLLAFAVIFVFSLIKRLIGHRTQENNFFGGVEYYLGMLGGMARYACILVAVLALLNARFYTVEDIQAHDAYVKRWFGGGIYSGNYFPDLQTIQGSVFKSSFCGPYLKDYLGPILIETVPSNAAKTAPKPASVKIQK
jgi:uncharacterized membrane protein required for colicin V production